MKECLREECKKAFEPNKPKQVFCSAKCRVYYGREKKGKEVIITDMTKPTNVVKPAEQPKSNYIAKVEAEKPTQQAMDDLAELMKEIQSQSK